MPETKLIPTYQYLGTLADTLYLTAQVARHPGSTELLLVNRVPHRQETRAFFCDLYASFARRPERSDFLELFSVNQDFYAVFRYNEGPSLASLYAGCPGAPGKRLRLLIDALFQVCSAAGDLPDAVVCSVLQPENLLLDDDERIRLLYQLHPEFLVEDAAYDVWSEAADLMEFLLEKELKSPYHKVLRNIHRMCRAGLYESLPAMISDLERAAETLAETGPIQSLKSFVLRKKARIAQISWLGMVTLFACLVVYLITELTGQQAADVTPISDIGTITYVASQDEEGGGMQLTDPAQPDEGGDVTFSSLPDASADLASEDYIVQPGDTLASICTAHYGSAGYAELVAGFNGLQTDSELDPGSILLLPLRDQLAQYMEN